jgi:cytochrome P450
LVPSGLEVWLVLRYGDIEMVFKDRRFSRREAIRRGAALVPDARMELLDGVLQNIDGEPHATMRRLFTDEYGHDRVPGWRAVIRRVAHAAIDGLTPGKVFDLRADFFEPVASRSAEEIFGFPEDWGPTRLEFLFDAGLMRDFQACLTSVLRREETLAEGSYLRGLAGACREGRIAEIDLINNLLVIMSATLQGLGGPFMGGLFALLRDRAQWEALVGDRSRVPNAVEEALRCFPNGDGQFLRVATEDVALSGVKIRRGEAVMAPAAAANIDPEVFPEPRRFDIRRSNSHRHMAFAAGPHFCLGWLLAKVWMQTALGVLLERLPSLRLAVEPEAVTYRPMPLINIMDRLPAKC